MIRKWKKDGRTDEPGAVPLELCSRLKRLHESYATAFIVALTGEKKKPPDASPTTSFYKNSLYRCQPSDRVTENVQIRGPALTRNTREERKRTIDEQICRNPAGHAPRKVPLRQPRIQPARDMDHEPRQDKVYEPQERTIILASAYTRSSRIHLRNRLRIPS